MAMLVRDRGLEKQVIADRRARGIDRYDEVWNGVYIMSPIADNEHQFLATRLAGILDLQAGLPEGTRVHAGTNISDRDDWTKNVRVPDVAVFLPGTTAINRESFWLGGPDLAVEVISKGDRARKKLPFYARVGTREVLLIDRKPWSLELYRLVDGQMELAGRSTVEAPAWLRSEVLPLAFRLTVDDVEGRPKIEVVREGRPDEPWLI